MEHKNAPPPLTTAEEEVQILAENEVNIMLNFKSLFASLMTCGFNVDSQR